MKTICTHKREGKHDPKDCGGQRSSGNTTEGQKVKEHRKANKNNKKTDKCLQ